MGYSRKKMDLTGQRYGKLTVLAPVKNVGNRTAWLCRCDCGQETVVKTHHLRSGHTKTCGCQNGAGGTRAALGLTYIDGTCVEMIRANTLRSNNTSGMQGVDWLVKKQRWRATICFQGKRRYLGSYKKFEDAVKARKRAEEDLFGTFLDACSGGILQSEQTLTGAFQQPPGNMKKRNLMKIVRIGTERRAGGNIGRADFGCF